MISSRNLSTESDIYRFEDSGVSLSISDSRANFERYVPAVSAALQKNRTLFDDCPSGVVVRIVNDDVEWQAAAGPYGHITFAWGVTLDDGRVVVKSPEFAGLDFPRFERVLTHEFNHSFWMQNFGGLGAGWSPNWVVEGLANLAGPARDLLSPGEAATFAIERKLDGRCLEYSYRDLTSPEELVFLYSLWRAVVSDLSPEGDVSKLMQCLRIFVQHPSEERFNQAFASIFGQEISTYFSEFLKRVGR